MCALQTVDRVNWWRRPGKVAIVNEMPAAESDTPPSSTRWPGIDVFRVVAIVSVVFIHIRPFTHERFDDRFVGQLDWIVNQSLRFAVPFFFIISGFFFCRSISAGAAPLALLRKYARRIAIAYIAWSAIYAIFGLAAYGNVFGMEAMFEQPLPSTPGEMVFSLLLIGTRTHMFFLPALLLGLAIVAMAHHVKKQNFILPLALCLYGVGVLARSYSDTRWGFDLGFNTRNGPCFSTLHVALGGLLVGRRTPPLLVAMGLFLVGGGLHLIEVRWLASSLGVDPMSHDFVFATPLFGLGFTFIVLRFKEIGASTRLPRAGQFTLGVYLAHILTIEIILLFRGPSHAVAAEILGPLLIYLLTLAAVLIAAKVRRLHPMLM